MRTNVYIDGFNLYYGCLKETPYRWLDLTRFCHLALPRNTINRIRYFTAIVKARPEDPQKPVRQQTYIRALQTIRNLTVHYGHYLESVKRMPLATPPEDQSVPADPSGRPRHHYKASGLVAVLRTESGPPTKHDNDQEPPD